MAKDKLKYYLMKTLKMTLNTLLLNFIATYLKLQKYLKKKFSTAQNHLRNSTEERQHSKLKQLEMTKWQWNFWNILEREHLRKMFETEMTNNAIIIIFHKKGRKDDLKNYRSICRLLVIYKIFPKIFISRKQNTIHSAQLREQAVIGSGDTGTKGTNELF